MDEPLGIALPSIASGKAGRADDLCSRGTSRPRPGGEGERARRRFGGGAGGLDESPRPLRSLPNSSKSLMRERGSVLFTLFFLFLEGKKTSCGA